MKLTTARINAALRAAGIDGVITKVEGSYYLSGDAFTYTAETCLFATSLNDLTLEGVLDDARRFAKESEGVRA